MAKRKSAKAKTHGGMTYKEIVFWGGATVAVVALLYFI